MPITKMLAIRLALHGCTNRPFYHVVVMLKHQGRDKPPIEQLGTYDPMKNDNDEVLVALNFERIKYWMSKGARPSQSVEKLLGLSGFLPIHPMTYITAKRSSEQAATDAEKSAEESKSEAVG